jgi:hypothetical protein
MRSSKSYRLKLELLENRVQPGSAMSPGPDLSMPAGPVLGDSLLSSGLTEDPGFAPKVAAPGGSRTAMPVEAGAFFTSPGQTPRPGGENLFGQGPVDHHLTMPLAPSPVDNQLAALLAASVRPGGAGNRPEAVPANTLFYGGDFDGQNDLSNENNSLNADARIYGNFYVTDPGGWDITTVFSNNDLSYYPSGGVNWEIRSGVSLNNGGTLVASGAGFPGTLTVVGGEDFGYLEVQVSADLTASPVHLDPGQYWLNVTPVGHGTGRSFCTETLGANAVGTQDPGNCFQDSTTFGTSFENTANLGVPGNFSLGVGGSVTGGPHASHVSPGPSGAPR